MTDKREVEKFGPAREVQLALVNPSCPFPSELRAHVANIASGMNAFAINKGHRPLLLQIRAVFLSAQQAALGGGQGTESSFAPKNTELCLVSRTGIDSCGIVRLVTSHSRFTKKGTATARYVYLPENMATKG
ncbi:predicted protein [Histoplasma capsulatum H143]|uniref:Uncharacterized protein n=1 Tax=Ajellomyces capsulatus (strain H143) TaxID=544712 RepID=C6H5D7_AJECH|nr:predicted protein [Histoplasma capsulatum H143]